jgi:hypothetical protein
MRNKVAVQMGDDGEVSFSLNDDAVPYIPLQSRFVVIVRPNPSNLSDYEKEAWDSWSDIQRISAALHIDTIELENILPYVGDSGRVVQKVWVDESNPEKADGEDNEEPHRELQVKLNTHGNFHPTFSKLSSGEQIYVLIEIGLAIARFSAQYVPTVLVLDIFRSIDSAGRKEWARFFSSPEQPFQTIVEAHLDSDLADVASSAAWEIVMLQGKPPSVGIHQIGATD